MATTLRIDSPAVNPDPLDEALISEADRTWWQSRHQDDWHDLDGPDCGFTDYDCSLDFEAEHQAEVDRWFRLRRDLHERFGRATAGEELPEEVYRWGGHPG